MRLISTRNTGNVVTALEGVLKGIADDGGLFVPETFPTISLDFIEALGEMDYAHAAAKVLALYFEVSEEDLLAMTQAAYGGFDDPRVTPMKRLGNREYILELFHGPTLAFKDMALQILPRLMSRAIDVVEQKEDVMILTATSGDTGKAALEGFADVPHTRITVFYPDEGVSDMQKLQMVTQGGDNTYVCAVRGNFDDAQTGVKKMFGDPKFNGKMAKEGYVLSSANSINFGRLAPQIVYYIYAYAHLMRAGEIARGEKVNITVPTGNFGNILAAYYAKRMGLPVAKLICASNKNNVLTDFFDSGRYVTQRTFFKTTSPSMDILISSNLERLLFEITDRDANLVKEWMESLSREGEYAIDGGLHRTMGDEFYADFADDVHGADVIRRVYRDHNYLMDTHTAVAQAVYEKYVARTGDQTATITASTASPFKFVQDVLYAITKEKVEDPFEAADRLCQVTGAKLPAQIAELRTAQPRFKDVANKEDLPGMILKSIGAE
ncbi:MAG: threonine synthase [Christensenellaceae bacterium]|nr:threonine synthase [Christensenellaceae bacterium]